MHGSAPLRTTVVSEWGSSSSECREQPILVVANPAIIYGPRGEAVSTPETRRLSAIQRQRDSLAARLDVAQTTDENAKHWAAADYLGPNAELNAATRRILRSRARYECANSCYLNGIVRKLANDTIGTGPSLAITDAAFTKDDAAQVESLFWEWCLSVDLPGKLRKMRLAKARDGETFAKVFSNPRAKTEVQFDFQAFEADHVAAVSIDNPMSSLLDGLIIDDFGNVIAYNVLDEHPGETGTVMFGKSELVPAEFILHLFHSDRPGQYRGCPEVLSTLTIWPIMRRITMASLVANEAAANAAWVLETQQPPSDMTYGDAFDSLQTRRGMGLVLPAGYKISQIESKHPSSEYPDVKREVLAEGACGAGMPYGLAAGDFSSYNFTSGRLDTRPYSKAIRIERGTWEVRACTPLFRGWFEEARRIPGYLPRVALKTTPRHEWRWDGEDFVDPNKETDAATSRVASGFSSFDDECNKVGGDRETIWRKNAQALGLTEQEYAKRMADKIFGAQVASSSQPTPEPQPFTQDNGGEQS